MSNALQNSSRTTVPLVVMRVDGSPHPAAGVTRVSTIRPITGQAAARAHRCRDELVRPAAARTCMIYSPGARCDGCLRAAGPAHRGPGPRAGRQVHFPPLRPVRRAGGGPIDHPRLRARRRLRLDARVPGRARRHDRAGAARRRRRAYPLSRSSAAGCAGCTRPAAALDAGNSGTTLRLLARDPRRPPVHRHDRPATSRCAPGRCAASSSRSAGWAPASTPTTIGRRSPSPAARCGRSTTRPPSPAPR